MFRARLAKPRKGYILSLQLPYILFHDHLLPNPEQSLMLQWHHVPLSWALRTYLYKNNNKQTSVCVCVKIKKDRMGLTSRLCEKHLEIAFTAQRVWKVWHKCQKVNRFLICLMSRIKEVIIFILFILFYINETTFIALYSVLISTDKLKLSQGIMMTVKDLEMKSHLRELKY